MGIRINAPKNLIASPWAHMENPNMLLKWWWNLFLPPIRIGGWFLWDILTLQEPINLAILGTGLPTTQETYFPSSKNSLLGKEANWVFLELITILLMGAVWETISTYLILVFISLFSQRTCESFGKISGDERVKKLWCFQLGKRKWLQCAVGYRMLRERSW